MTEHRMSEAHFRSFALHSMLRDWLHPPAHVIAEAALKPGDVVLDLGAGRGSFAIAASEVVGPAGKVFAVDEHPLAIATIKKRLAQARIENVEVLEGTAPAVLAAVPAAAVDAVLLFDVFHHMAAVDEVTAALARVLKPEGVVFIANPDKHVPDEELAVRLTQTGLFMSAGRTEHLLLFGRKP